MRHLLPWLPSECPFTSTPNRGDFIEFLFARSAYLFNPNLSNDDSRIREVKFWQKHFLAKKYALPRRGSQISWNRATAQ